MSSKIVVKGYQVGALIDQSGMRSLYRARHLSSGKELFLTVISVRPGRSLEALKRRAQQSKRITLQGLVPATDFGVLPDDKFFFSHQAIPSFPITQGLAEVADPTERLYALMKYFLNALELVDYIHEAGATHRDLGTPLLRLDINGSVLLEGFVNARPKVEPRNIANVVNLPYMSPEQLMGTTPADRKTDIYSMGVVLFELVTGALPYESNHSKVEDSRQGIVPTPSMHKIDIPPSLEAIIMKALSPRGSRYQHARELIADIEAFRSKRSLKLKFKDFTSSLRNSLSIGKAG